MPWPHQPPRRTEPYTEAELIDMRKAGDTVSNIAMRAYRINGWKIAKVREVLFGRNY